MSSQTELNAQDALDAITRNLQAGDDVDNLLTQTDAASTDAGELADIIRRLHAVLTPAEPSRDFADELRADLLDDEQGMVLRVRQMPARVHVAAILALIAGCLLFIMRRLFGSDAPQEIQEEAVATPL